MLKLGLVCIVFAVLQVVAFADTPMVTINGHTMVSLRAFRQQFGAVTDYDAATNSYSVSRNNRTVYLIPYSTIAWIDDSLVDLKVPPVLVDNHLYVPMRFMCRTFDLDCTWGTAYSQVVIFDGFTGQQVIWLRDDGWAGRPHSWQHPVTFRIAVKLSSSPRQFFQGKHSASSVPATMPAGHGQPAPNHGHQPASHGQPPTIGTHAPPTTGHAPTAGGYPPTTGGHAPTVGGHTPPTSMEKSPRVGTNNTQNNHTDKNSNNDDKRNGR